MSDRNPYMHLAHSIGYREGEADMRVKAHADMKTAIEAAYADGEKAGIERAIEALVWPDVRTLWTGDEIVLQLRALLAGSE